MPGNTPELECRIQNDGISASIVIPENTPAVSLCLDTLTAVLQTRGVVVDQAVITNIKECLDAYEPNTEAREYVLANASPAEDGIDEHYTWVEGKDPFAANDKTTSEDGVVDFYNCTTYTHVVEGEMIGNRHPATDGTDGRDVQGNTIPARPGRPCKWSLASSISVSDDNSIVAQCDGILQIAKNTIEVANQFTIDGDVDFEQGNIDFDGAVTIRGGVKDCFTVKATGDLKIGGLVEAATIQSGANLTVSQGMAAKDKGRIAAQGDAHVGYLNNVTGRIGRHLIVQRELIGCALIVNGSLKAEAATVIGGRVCVGADLSCSVLGSDGDIQTVITFACAPLLVPRLKTIVGEVTRQEHLVEQEQAEYRRLEASSSRLSPQERERLTELSFELETNREQLQRLLEERARLQELVARQPRPTIVVRKLIHARTEFVLGRTIVHFDKQVKGPVRIGRDEHGCFTYSIADGPSQPLESVATISKRMKAA